MLVLGRRKLQEIIIKAFTKDGQPTTITISVLEIKERLVRIGIDAPRELTVLRTELKDNESGH